MVTIVNNLKGIGLSYKFRRNDKRAGVIKASTVLHV